MYEILAAWLNNLTGVEGSLGYLLVLICAFSSYKIISSQSSVNAENKKEVEEEDEPEPQRNFTFAQLRFFDGTVEKNTDEKKPVYLSVNGIVFNVSNGRDFYGPGGPYELFAGHECGVALAKMSFDTTHLDNLVGCLSLNFGEKNELDGWIDKFQYYRCYPIMGRLVPDDDLTSSDRIISLEDLANNDGTGEIPKGYAAAPIYLCAKGRVYDVSFGGVTFYGPGCAYAKFAGKDVSRALAKMSFDPNDIEVSDISDLSDKEKKVLDDWVKTFEEKKLYPCIGNIFR